MPVQVIKDKNNGKINTVVLGATAADGGTRTSTITLGGANCLPFMSFEGEIGSKPVFAMEIIDMVPSWNPECLKAIGDAVNCPAAWAKKAVEEFGADMIYLKLMSADPENGNSSPEKCVETVKAVLNAVGVPVAVVGCGIGEIDNKIIPAVAEACAGENLLLGHAETDNYNTAAAACMVHKHTLIASSPLDINICKQLNILVTDMGLPANKIVIDPSVGGLGYGIEYSYSIMERGRIGSLQGDKMLSMPVICMIGHEAWKAKEANVGVSEFPGWGEQEERGILWEAVTAAAHLQAGIDILVMRHPEALKLARENAEQLSQAVAY